MPTDQEMLTLAATRSNGIRMQKLPYMPIRSRDQPPETRSSPSTPIVS